MQFTENDRRGRQGGVPGSGISARLAGCLAGIIVIFLGLRLTRLGEIPLFIDEALHLNWAAEYWQGEFSGAVADGKFLYCFLLIPSLFFDEPIRMARLISLAISLGALLLLFLAARRLFDDATAFLSMLIYAICPLVVLHDPMVMQESLMVFFGLVSLLASLRLVRRGTLGDSALLHLALTLGFLSKLPALYYLALPGLSFWASEKRIAFRRYAGRLAAFAWVPAAVVLVLLLSGWGRQEAAKITPGEILYVKQLRTVLGYLATSLTWPLTGAYFLSVILALVHGKKLVLLLFAFSFTPLLIFPLFFQPLFSRYLIFLLPFMMLCVAWTLRILIFREGQGWRWARTLVLTILLIPSLMTDHEVWRNWETTRIPELDQWQYGTGWPAGYGLREAADFLKRINEGSYRVIADLRSMYRIRWLIRDPKAAIDWVSTRDPDALRRIEWLPDQPVFLVLDDPLVQTEGMDLARVEEMATLVEEFARPTGRSRILVYRVNRPRSSR